MTRLVGSSGGATGRGMRGAGAAPAVESPDGDLGQKLPSVVTGVIGWKRQLLQTVQRSPTPSHDNMNAIAIGISVGITVLLMISVYLLYTFWWAPRRQRLEADEKARAAASALGANGTPAGGRTSVPNGGGVMRTRTSQQQLCGPEAERRRRASIRLAQEVRARNSTTLSAANLALHDMGYFSDPGPADDPPLPPAAAGGSANDAAWPPPAGESRTGTAPAGSSARPSSQMPRSTNDTGVDAASRGLWNILWDPAALLPGGQQQLRKTTTGVPPAASPAVAIPATGTKTAPHRRSVGGPLAGDPGAAQRRGASGTGQATPPNRGRSSVDEGGQPPLLPFFGWGAAPAPSPQYKFDIDT